MTSNNGSTTICPVIVELQPAARDANIAQIVFTVVTQFIMVVHFYLNRNESVFLRKRSFNLVAISCSGSLIIAFTYYLGAMYPFPCAVTGAMTQSKNLEIKICHVLLEPNNLTRHINSVHSVPLRACCRTCKPISCKPCRECDNDATSGDQTCILSTALHFPARGWRREASRRQRDGF